LIALVRAYQHTLGLLLGGQCRYEPTCSHYAIDALQEHGAWRGSWLALRRVLRCHPFGGSGHDPVPRTGKQTGSSHRRDDTRSNTNTTGTH